MARRTFFSFHYQPDSWRSAQVRNIGALNGNRAVTDNDWESIVAAGPDAIQRWIDDQMSGRTVVAVLIGAQTSTRAWVRYEIDKGWKDGKGVFGVYIHNLHDSNGEGTSKGLNPLDYVARSDGQPVSATAKAYDPPYSDSKNVYSYIEDNIEAWADEAVRLRNAYSG